jgi:hypothetical protein
MRTALLLADRTAVLFLGIAAGAAIGYAFGSSGSAPSPSVVAGSSVESARSSAAVAPPPPTGPAAPPLPTAASGPARLEYAQSFQPHLLQAIAAGRPVTVGVFGDSFGDGVYTALYRLLPTKDRFRVLKFSQQSTGFTRYGRMNLQERAERQIAEEGPIDLAVISFGANDTQGVYADGHAAALMSPEWQRIVGERVDGFVGLMRARGVAVYWLGLPKMRAAAFDADIAAMNDFYRRRMAALGVPFIDVHPLTVDAAGNYAAYLPDPINGNEPRLLRANDGIHMSMNGYVVITRALAGRIRDYVAAATQVALPGAPPEAAVPPAPAPVVVPAPSPRPAIRRPEAKPAAPRPKPETAPVHAVKPVPASPAEHAPALRPAAPRVEAPAAAPAAKPVAKPTAAEPKKPAPAPAKPAAERKKPAAVPIVRPSPPPLQLKLPPPEPETVAPPAGDRK